MSFSYLFDPNKQFQDRNGVNNVGGFLRVYIDGTDDRATTYKDFNGTLNEADIMLDTDGRAVVIVDDNLTFRIEVYERGGALQWTVTQFTARGEGGGGGGGSSTPVVVDGTANEIDVTESMTAGVKYYKIGLATVVKNTLLGLLASFSNLVGILNSKTDKVQGATAGNLAALDASGNLTDSGSKAADFKTKQTPVADPSASGNGLDFIDSISQDANGEITPHKKSVQDGTTAQKGVLQLQDSIGSTESATDKAVTPHAVREAINSAVSSAYHAAGTKTVAQLTSSLLVAENEGCVYNMTDSGTTTSDFVDGAGHPINAGDNVGVCDVGGGVYKFDLLSGFVDLGNYLTKTGDASNTTSTFTKASGDTSTIASGGKLSAIFTAISSFFASLKALAFKDKASYSDLSSGVQSSLDKADSALQSHQSVTDNNPTLAWGTTSKVGKVGSTDLQVTMPSLDTAMSSSSDNAVKNKVVDAALKAISRLWREIIGETAVDLNDLYVNDGQFKLYEWGYSSRNNVSNKPVTGGGELVVLSYGDNSVMQLCLDGSDGTKCYARHKNSSGWTDWFDIRSASWINSGTFDAARIPASLPNTTTGNANYAAKIGTSSAHPQIGSESIPVYVDSNGQVQPCDPLQMNVGSANTAQYAVSASNAQSGSTLETQVNNGLAAYKETYTNVTLIQGNIYSKTIVLEIGQENSSGNGIRLFLNNNIGTFEVSIRTGTWNNWMDGGSVIWMLQASFGVGVNSPVTKINNDTKSLANLTTQNIGGVDIGGSPGQYPVNGTISGRFYFVNNAASGILTFEASFSTSQSTQYGGLNDTFVIGKAEWTSFADHKVTSILT